MRLAGREGQGIRDMSIKTVEAWWIKIPIEASRQHRSDLGRLTTFDSAILR
ncbi:mandelate racemase/muconate lactonizing enzyme family protein, partial [Rhizobium ruizarguesonis]